MELEIKTTEKIIHTNSLLHNETIDIDLNILDNYKKWVCLKKTKNDR